MKGFIVSIAAVPRTFTGFIRARLTSLANGSNLL